MPQLKIPHAATKTQSSQINKYLKKEEKKSNPESGRAACMYFYFYFFLGCAAQLVGSQFPNEGLNLGHGSKSLES